MHYFERPAWRNQWFAIVLAVILIAWMLGASVWRLFGDGGYWAGLFLYVAPVALAALISTILYRHYSWRFIVDGERIESRQGLIARRIQSIRIRDLRNVNVEQSIVQRILGIGNIEFSSSAGGGVEVVFVGVAGPLEVRGLVQRLRNT